jgi:hypothetical protein
MKAVSCSKQFPHKRQPNNGLLIAYSVFASSNLPKVSFLKGEMAGCQHRPGVKIAIEELLKTMMDKARGEFLPAPRRTTLE